MQCLKSRSKCRKSCFRIARFPDQLEILLIRGSSPPHSSNESHHDPRFLASVVVGIVPLYRVWDIRSGGVFSQTHTSYVITVYTILDFRSVSRVCEMFRVYVDIPTQWYSCVSENRYSLLESQIAINRKRNRPPTGCEPACNSLPMHIGIDRRTYSPRPSLHHHDHHQTRDTSPLTPPEHFTPLALPNRW